MKKWAMLGVIFMLASSRTLGAASAADDFKDECLKVLWDLNTAFQDLDAYRFMESVSPRYQSGNPLELKMNLEMLFRQMVKIDLDMVVDRVMPVPGAKALAIKVHWEKRRFPKGIYQPQLFSGQTEMIFGREDETVRLQSSRGDVLFG